MPISKLGVEFSHSFNVANKNSSLIKRSSYGLADKDCSGQFAAEISKGASNRATLASAKTKYWVTRPSCDIRSHLTKGAVIVQLMHSAGFQGDPPRNFSYVSTPATRICHRDGGIIVAGHFENKCAAKTHLD